MGVTKYVPPAGINEEVTFRDIVSENENYLLVIGKMKNTDYESYLAVNRNTGVIEGTHQVLSHSLDMIEAFDKWLRHKSNGDMARPLEEVTDGIFE